MPEKYELADESDADRMGDECLLRIFFKERSKETPIFRHFTLVFI
jgi:hypothetical protein